MDDDGFVKRERERVDENISKTFIFEGEGTFYLPFLLNLGQGFAAARIYITWKKKKSVRLKCGNEIYVYIGRTRKVSEKYV